MRDDEKDTDGGVAEVFFGFVIFCIIALVAFHSCSSDDESKKYNYPSFNPLYEIVETLRPKKLGDSVYFLKIDERLINNVEVVEVSFKDEKNCDFSDWSDEDKDSAYEKYKQPEPINIHYFERECECWKVRTEQPKPTPKVESECTKYLKAYGERKQLHQFILAKLDTGVLITLDKDLRFYTFRLRIMRDGANNVVFKGEE